MRFGILGELQLRLFYNTLKQGTNILQRLCAERRKKKNAYRFMFCGLPDYFQPK